ncbi:regulatory protein TetR [Gordonia bronchialis DSM 43247]|mgnify:FL=1|uniref:Regulatory protein TetR n=1 Tax=Gordonia bronchialis (strain ATCC 25592 / DSM 43247 / BCRC 13721 / JCM 3198 / KCTC 3076 / NBRC 16047 / NCTC 10667) TaxID=526226 RepID=D0L3J5_GORB4|nr:cholesterol catabolism transcriptional regulator KstR [Gordonia bronchialis]ACY20194.1 regulatory protein TetR [Gordonia bronchialis DSM 43247]MCC3322967.1 cholesterol catabolism transcriptional regulator KstR [Gordonia bronchialis]QGS27198.1 cholesterol catabolism transcriptional regulator KstR [Gordonia bronchialis]UAK40758.1 cholesterol catabolism transcriptional regulator KstR [Gordonia bronchialis]STQ62993.1 HTH-type transcriptional repressor KstR [Gordonia bronchialis]
MARSASGNAAIDAPDEDAAPNTSVPEAGSSAQRERRRRILDATLALASKGGYDAVQMRTVADKADVAVGTLYRYFPSKVHLLVTSLARELGRVESKVDRSQLRGDNAIERLRHVLDMITFAMQRDPLLTEAMTRAFMFADASATAEVDQVASIIDRLLAGAIVDEGEPTDEDLAIARVLADVWMSNLVQWLTRRASATDVTNRLELTVRLLLKDRIRES